jgi:putative endonuclease
MWRRWFGQRSERFAARYLKKLGWRILGANLVAGGHELDVLAIDGRVLVFVEVRSVSGNDPTVAARSVDLAKQRKLSDGALGFLSRRRLLNHPYRFDVVALAWPAEARTPVLLHQRAAFDSTHRWQMHS